MAFAAPLVAALPAFLGSAGFATGLGVAGAGLAGLTAIQNGNYRAAVAKNNEQIAQQNAARLSEASQIEAQRSDIDYRAMLSEQLAEQGASGFDVLGRSQTSSRALTRRTGRKAARDIRLEGESAAGRELQEGANQRAAGRQAKLQGYLSAGGSLLEAGTLISGRRRRSFERRP